MTNYVYQLEEVEETSTVDSVEIILRGQKKCDYYMLAKRVKHGSQEEKWVLLIHVRSRS
jgi:hypothetical protein